MKEVFLAPGFQDQTWEGSRPLLLFTPFFSLSAAWTSAMDPPETDLFHFPLWTLSCLGGKYPELIVENLQAAGEVPVPEGAEPRKGTDEVSRLSSASREASDGES